MQYSHETVCVKILFVADGGHDSKEDAVSCMELMKWKIKSDLQKTTRRGSVT